MLSQEKMHSCSLGSRRLAPPKLVAVLPAEAVAKAPAGYRRYFEGDRENSLDWLAPVKKVSHGGARRLVHLSNVGVEHS